MPEQLAENSPVPDAASPSFRHWLADRVYRIAARLNDSIHKDGEVAMTAGLRLATYTTATLPSASPDGQIIYVSDGAAGARFRGSHGGAWVNLG